MLNPFKALLALLPSEPLQVGDVVTGVNGLPITGKTDLTAQIRALPAGAEAVISYVRGGKSATVEVILGTLI